MKTKIENPLSVKKVSKNVFKYLLSQNQKETLIKDTFTLDNILKADLALAELAKEKGFDFYSVDVFLFDTHPCAYENEKVKKLKALEGDGENILIHLIGQTSNPRGVQDAVNGLSNATKFHFLENEEG